MGYIRLLRKKAAFGFLIILGCACLGSIRGAMKENREPFIGVTQKDLEISKQAGKSAPDLTGLVALAFEQNRWRNFSYAAIYSRRGIVIYCILTAVYFPVYRIMDKRKGMNY